MDAMDWRPRGYAQWNNTQTTEALSGLCFGAFEVAISRPKPKDEELLDAAESMYADWRRCRRHVG